jgi:transcriptional regulator with XRE-family HTH domain
MPDPDVIARAIARNLRRIRASRGWSLDQLAARSGVSRGMVIQIEQARTNPSVATLVRISDALSVSIAQLVDIADTPTVRLVRAADSVPLWHSDNGGVGTLLVGSDRTPILELWDWRMGPGDVREAEAHVAGTTELLFVLEGELSMTVDGTAYLLATGDSVIFPGDRVHTYANAGSTPLRFVMSVTTTPPQDPS